jgi:FtsH-binding integral membrane protein
MPHDRRTTELGWAAPPADPNQSPTASHADPEAHAAGDASQLPHYLYEQAQYGQSASPYPVYSVHALTTGGSPPTATPREPAIHQAPPASTRRARFIKLTYLHLFLAILAFAGLLRALMTQPVLVAKVSVPLTTFALAGRWNWGVVLGAFIAVSWIADRWASHATSKFTQYLGLGFYVVAESLIFVPLLAIVTWKTQAILARGGAEPHIVRDAAFVTLGVFTMLTLSVVISKKDFSFLRGGLAVASGAALSLIAMSLVFGFNLGLVFSVAMVVLAAGYMLYQTSQVLAHYHPGQHVAAALALFSSVALMFWYVIRIFLRARD